MGSFASRADLQAIEAESAWEDRDLPRSMYEFLTRTKAAHGARPALSYQLLSTPGSKSETLTWAELHGRVTQAANLFHSLGIGEKDVVAYVLPNAVETAVTLLGGAVAGIVNPINPLLEAEQISAILRETKAKVVVTVKAFPKTDLPQKVSEAVKHAPSVKTVLEVDLLRYLGGVKRLIVPLIRPKNPIRHTANVKSFNAECRKQPADMPAVHALVYELALYEREPEAVFTTPEEYLRDFQAGRFECRVAEIDSEVVGMTLFYEAYSTWKGRMLYLDDFVVKESHRGEGIGQLLFDDFVAEGRRRGCRLVKWQVLD